MGKLNISKHLFPAPVNEGDAVEIAAVPKVREVELTRVIYDSDTEGSYRYDGHSSANLSELVVRSLDYDNPELCFQRLEVRVLSSSNSLPPGSILCCSEIPYSSFWAATTPFLKGSKKGLPKISDRQTMLSEVEKAKVNWWDSDMKYLTAALPESKFQYYLYARRKFPNYNPSWLLAVVINDSGEGQLNINKVESALFTSEPVQGYIRKASEGSIRVGKNRKHPLRLSQEEASSLAFLAIRQALAGPAKDIENREHLPVVDEFIRIYTDQLHTLSEREARGKQREVLDHENYDEVAHNFLGSSAITVDPAVIWRVRDGLTDEKDLALWQEFEKDIGSFGDDLRSSLENSLHE